MNKAEKIIARFTSCPDLTKKILGHVEGVRNGTKTIDQIIDEHTSNPAIKAKVYEGIARVKRGHTIASITGYHAPNMHDAQLASDASHQHVGAIKQIYAESK